ncbi:MAG: DUF853 family protein [Bdellovibrionales bacterium]|nr:DUF853 family protein [Bdellovibrionales bacterium]
MINQEIIVGASLEKKVSLLAAMANRHGLITGATGTGKTVTLQLLAESFARLGVPVFAADIKGDLSGLAATGSPHPKIEDRLKKIGLENFNFEASPSVFWDVYGEKGHPVRITVSEMGPLLLSHVLELNEVQEGVIHVAFKLADEEGLLLLDLKDLRSLLEWLAENEEEVSAKYGRVSAQSIGAIQRRLLMLESAGGTVLFGEPALQIKDLLHRDFSGRAVISVLEAGKLFNNPRVYTTFLLWLLSELFEELPEVGDQELPKMIFFFDEAHLLFDQASKPLLERIEQVIRLIRSKGVGIFFVTQHPLDIPESVLGQLGNRVQHALRAFTPKEKQAVKTAANTFRQNPNFNAEEEITNLGVGEALVSTLDEKGVPTIVEKVLISPPQSRIGAISEQERISLIERSPLKGVYDKIIDRESAYEVLQKRRKELADKLETEASSKKKSNRQSASEAFLKSILRSVGSSIGRSIARGVLGSVLRR